LGGESRGEKKANAANAATTGGGGGGGGGGAKDSGGGASTAGHAGGKDAGAAHAAPAPATASPAKPTPSSTVSTATTTGAASSPLLPDRDDDEDEAGHFRPSRDVAALLGLADASASASAAAAAGGPSGDASAQALRLKTLLEALPRLGSREAVDEWCVAWGWLLSDWGCYPGWATISASRALTHFHLVPSPVFPHSLSPPMSLPSRAHDFVLERLNTRANRARLLKAVAGASPVLTDVLPYYARLVATLDAAVPGFAAPLVELAADELRFLQKRRSRSHADLKVRDARLLGELVKFQVASPAVLLAALARCLEDWGNPDATSLLCTIIGACVEGGGRGEGMGWGWGCGGRHGGRVG
jgi:hypothetical protein